MIAEDEHGNRKRMHVVTLHACREREVMEQAEKVANALINRLASGKPPPVAFDRWHDTFAAYGSPAYSEEDTIAWEARMEEDAQWQ